MFGPDLTLFDTLKGRWIITRQVDDRYTKLKGSFEGTATFLPTASPGALEYRETGTLSFGPFEHAAERVYRWQCKAPDQASVSFEDGRDFHVVIPKDGISTAEHQCGQDTYTGRYVFEAADRWRLSWRVKGPRKDYTMDSTYTRP